VVRLAKRCTSQTQIASQWYAHTTGGNKHVGAFVRNDREALAQVLLQYCSDCEDVRAWRNIGSMKYILEQCNRVVDVSNAREQVIDCDCYNNSNISAHVLECNLLCARAVWTAWLVHTISCS
jgi:hypothetical protein